jgi:hypothetical protein
VLKFLLSGEKDDVDALKAARRIRSSIIAAGKSSTTGTEAAT